MVCRPCIARSMKSCARSIKPTPDFHNARQCTFKPNAYQHVHQHHHYCQGRTRQRHHHQPALHPTQLPHADQHRHRTTTNHCHRPLATATATKTNATAATPTSTTTTAGSSPKHNADHYRGQTPTTTTTSTTPSTPASSALGPALASWAGVAAATRTALLYQLVFDVDATVDLHAVL